MRISYDNEMDALYVRFIEGEVECRTLQLNEDIALNIGPGEKLVGVEILDAREYLGGKVAPEISLDNVRVAAH
jgi:uncharacterized protein YuzE